LGLCCLARIIKIPAGNKCQRQQNSRHCPAIQDNPFSAALSGKFCPDAVPQKSGRLFRKTLKLFPKNFIHI
jgi:hypothetical protein